MSPEVKHVLVIDDDRFILEIIIEILQREGYSVEGTQNGQLALEALNRDPLPDLILLDLMMPEMDGFQFREQQLQSPRIQAIPTVVMSADGAAHKNSQRLSGAYYLKKPIDLETLLETVKRFAFAKAG